MTSPLRIGVKPQIDTTPGVKQEVYAAWFGGIYKDPRDFSEFTSLVMARRIVEARKGECAAWLRGAA